VAHTVSNEHKTVLFAMGLIMDGIEGLEVTELGRRRIERGDIRGEEWFSDLLERSPSK
jgi:hypothetical protein